MNTKQSSRISDFMNCAMCSEACNDVTAIKENIICKTSHFVIGINPRWSPHLGRVFIAPLRHIGADGVYGFQSLTSEEYEEFVQLRKKLTDAIIAAFPGIKTRDGCPHIDYIVRPSVHPSADLFADFEDVPSFEGYTWPKYKLASFSQGSAPDVIQDAPVILTSLSNPALVMPQDLRIKLKERIYKYMVLP